MSMDFPSIIVPSISATTVTGRPGSISRMLCASIGSEPFFVLPWGMLVVNALLAMLVIMPQMTTKKEKKRVAFHIWS